MPGGWVASLRSPSALPAGSMMKREHFEVLGTGHKDDMQKRLIETLQEQVAMLEKENKTPPKNERRIKTPRSRTPTVTPRTKLRARRSESAKVVSSPLEGVLVKEHGSVRAAYANLSSLHSPELSPNKAFLLNKQPTSRRCGYTSFTAAVATNNPPPVVPPTTHHLLSLTTERKRIESLITARKMEHLAALRSITDQIQLYEQEKAHLLDELTGLKA
eukprot:TRINITY_DN13793_c0_g1_i1.p1 TRINITY_DN13793_c0_g1~~TRINITY_DN13793_c0_g1_i1.p1  ORF type:complete len:217 (+),score=48.72 TRINITY_DN13793_c0_g1_i1:61-711(+)